MNKMLGGTCMSNMVVAGQEADDIKRPEVMAYIDRLQRILESQEVVGKTTSVADIHDSDCSFQTGPTVQDEIGQYLFLFQMAGDASDLDDFVDNDFQNTNIWVQMRRGDNRKMENYSCACSAFHHPKSDT